MQRFECLPTQSFTHLLYKLLCSAKEVHVYVMSANVSRVSQATQKSLVFLESEVLGKLELWEYLYPLNIYISPCPKAISYTMGM